MDPPPGPPTFASHMIAHVPHDSLSANVFAVKISHYLTSFRSVWVVDDGILSNPIKMDDFVARFASCQTPQPSELIFFSYHTESKSPALRENGLFHLIAVYPYG